MAVRREARARCHAILVDDEERTKAGLSRVVIVAEREAVAAVEPREPCLSPCLGRPDGDHRNLSRIARPLGVWSRRETLAIGLRRRTEQAQEAAAHGFLGAEAAARRDALYRQALLEHLASRLDSDPFDGARRRHAGRPAIMTNEAALAHRGSIGERGDRQIAAKIIGDPGMEAL